MARFFILFLSKEKESSTVVEVYKIQEELHQLYVLLLQNHALSLNFPFSLSLWLLLCFSLLYCSTSTPRSWRCCSTFTNIFTTIYSYNRATETSTHSYHHKNTKTSELRVVDNMERKALVLCGVVGFLGILSAATGFAAEATRIKGSEVQFTSVTQCTYPRSPALALGLTAAVALMMAQIIINVATGCICCKRGPHPSNSNWTIALICFVVSWFTFVIAFLLLLTGAALNDQHYEESRYFGSYYCYVVKPGVFAGGAVLSFASITLGILYYLTLNPGKSSGDPWFNAPVSNQSGIAMGQPQFTTQSTQEPVFVHEDTYMRRQFT